MNRFSRFTIALLIVALASGGLFFSQLDRLWPLLPGDLTTDRAAIERSARQRLALLGVDLDGRRCAVAVEVNETLVDYCDSSFSRPVAAGLAASGGGAYYKMVFKQEGVPDAVTFRIDPLFRPLSLRIDRQEDDSGPRIPIDSAALIARAAALSVFDIDLSDSSWRPLSASSVELPARRDHAFVYERTISVAPELKERISISIAGESLALAARGLVTPPAALRAARAGNAAASSLETLGFLLLGLAIAIALLIFFRALKTGRAALGHSTGLATVIMLLLWSSYPFRRVWLFDSWDPLWPFAASAFRAAGFAMLSDLRTWIVLLVFIGAGGALDAAAGFGRGDSLRSFVTGGWRDRRIPIASLRGFLIGLISGGVLIIVVAALERFVGAHVALQPRGFFLYSLNSSLPALSIAVFFLHTALLEELGYRWFAGTWILKSTKSRALAILLPAIVYGLTHANFTFLPPDSPWWARAFTLACVGAVWGWAFLKYDALTVVLSHYTADLFIFSIPWIFSGNEQHRLMAYGLVALPLIPALAWFASPRGAVPENQPSP